MTSSRQNCLFVLSSAIEGVSAQSFIQAYTLAQTAFSVQLASINGRPTEFVHQDESSRRWLNDFRTKPTSNLATLESIDPSRFSALVIPESPGAVSDLSNNTHLSTVLHHFVDEHKPICAVGMGVAGLFSAKEPTSKVWRLKNFCMTATSVFELAKTSTFSSLPLIPEDFIKDNLGKYTCSDPGEIHVVLDRFLVTAQNVASTLLAVQNLILLSNHRSGGYMS